MVITGAMHHQPQLKAALDVLASKGVVILTETLSNLVGDHYIRNMDRVVATVSEDEQLFFSPDLLITLDVPVLSKMVKKIIRQRKPHLHWHFSNQTHITDTRSEERRVGKEDIH